MGRGESRAQRFETEAFVYLDVLYGAALRMTQNRVEAEDLVQDTFLRAYIFFDRYERNTNCRAWLLKIMANHFINNYNRKKNEPDTVRFDDIGESHIYQKTLDSDYIENPEYPVDRIYRNLFDDDIRELLSGLPREFRTSIILCDIQGFTYARAAEATNVTIGTVKSRLFRARRRLQKGLLDWASANGYALKGCLNESA